MSLLEKYLEGKNEMYAKFDEAREEMEKSIEAAGSEFLEKFKEMIASASNEEFHEFMCNSGDELDEIERMAALTARLEAHEKKRKDKRESKEPEDESKKNDGPHVVIIGLG